MVNGGRRRRSIRLRCFDYSACGAYFVTIVTQDRARLLGSVEAGVVQTSAAGRMVQAAWDALPTVYPGVDVDAFVVMPDHIHGIIVFAGDHPMGSRSGSALLSLPDIVRVFKTMTTRRYIDGVRNAGWPAFRGRLWQRNYYERILRDDEAVRQVRSYIDANPARWCR